jgi:hypothetical protein
MLDDTADDAPLAAADVGHVDLHCNARRPLPPASDARLVLACLDNLGAFKSVADTEKTGTEMGVESLEGNLAEGKIE